VNHDLDDAVRAKVLREEEVPAEVTQILGRTCEERMGRMVRDIVETSSARPRADGSIEMIRLSEEVLTALLALRDFLYERVYEKKEIREEFERAQRLLGELFTYLVGHEEEFRARFWPKGVPPETPLARAVGDFVAGMTDRYAMRMCDELLLPRRWIVM
jgi:dGTPase